MPADILPFVRIDSLHAVPAVLFTVAAVWALSVVLFRSFPADELSARMLGSPDLERLRVRQWELRHGERWRPERMRQDNMVGAQPLTPGELAVVLREYRELTRRTRPARAFAYLMGCTLCQTLWAGIVLLVLYWISPEVGGLVVTVCGYAGLALRLFVRSGGSAPAADPKRLHVGGGGCGK